VKEFAGVLVKDLARYVRLLRRKDSSDYLRICNRAERLELGPGGLGYRCDWKWTSELHAPKHLSVLGRWLMKRALADHPIGFAERPRSEHESPDISFIIGHRGDSRLPHLLSTLASIAAQRDIVLECLVIEQDVRPQLPAHLPSWVRHVHTPPPDAGMAYCRSWAFNIGARLARGRVLVLHDNDILVPRDYGAHLLAHFREGFDMVNLKRFVFYLSAGHTDAVLGGEAAGLADAPLEAIVQNAECGASVAVLRDAYERIGGMDESFIGWGGEDNEFCERAHTLRTWPYAYLPFVHLWHPAQPGKQRLDNPTLRRFHELSAIPAKDRVARLRQLQGGSMAGPIGWSLPEHSGLERRT
jgi:GT2 family glycosyltransferase